ncbi:hypothetical protein [Mycoplasma sp. VS42A]
MKTVLILKIRRILSKGAIKVGTYTVIGINRDGYKELLSVQVKDVGSKIN